MLVGGYEITVRVATRRQYDDANIVADLRKLLFAGNHLEALR